jgi:hypothetical protein
MAEGILWGKYTESIFNGEKMLFAGEGGMLYEKELENWVFQKKGVNCN